MKRFMIILITFFSIALLLPLLFNNYAVAAGFDITKGRRIDIKCPSRIEDDKRSEIIKGGLIAAFNLYDRIDPKLNKSNAGEGKYVFEKDTTEGYYFIAYAKTTFARGVLSSLHPQKKIRFLDVFFVIEIDIGKSAVRMLRRQDRLEFTIGMSDFDKAFIWYSDLLDKSRAYIPIYGFLSIPAKEKKPPVIFDGWGHDKRPWIHLSQGLKHFDFYKVLDYQDGYFLLAEDRYFRYIGEKAEYGIIGWVEEKYVVLWKSRLYYHPLRNVKYYNSPGEEFTRTDEVNKFYLNQTYPGREELARKIPIYIEHIDNYYKNFGFPELYQTDRAEENYTKVCILGAFTTKIVKALIDAIKGSINTFFLMDISTSMEPFKDFVMSFTEGVRNMGGSGFDLNESAIFTYWDSNNGKGINFQRISDEDDIQFGKEFNDIDYKEPLFKGLEKTLAEIQKLQTQKIIDPIEYKLLFIMTDAGANDKNIESMSRVTKLIGNKELDVFVFFIVPDQSGAQQYDGMIDTPEDAYEDLISTASQLRIADERHYKFLEVSSQDVRFPEKRRESFDAACRKILSEIEAELKVVFENPDQVNQILPILSFIPIQLLKTIGNWTTTGDHDIQINNHIVKFIKNVENKNIWQERVAIPADIIDTYVRARDESNITLLDLKKMFIINSLVSVTSIKKCRELYDQLKEIIDIQTSENLEDLFYKAITGRPSPPDRRWNYSLSRDQLRAHLKDRIFYLNSAEQTTRSRFVYLNKNEFFEGGK